ncbi:conserved hypothetical protein [Sporisorium reilianum SRZ2]|uniref:BZIP domain-containing protein n=1 Tax=Sporisorium reilianum (strain SRZ2) TaxID=999809 RepID=E6ZRC3_SPORE|nr:conserved hypothetical protein [Sporisorium reilianum SRZ2]
MAASGTAEYPRKHSSSSRVECDGTSGSHSFEDGRSDTKSEDGDALRPYQHDTSPPEEVHPTHCLGADSATLNARASRMFRERRKERERVLRETVAELAERNAALEALLLRHGIVPPHSHTLRHELSLHRSQRLGGPPIHIPGLTPLRPASIPSITEPGNHHGDPPDLAPSTREFIQPWSAPPHLETAASSHPLSHNLGIWPAVGRAHHPPAAIRGRHPSISTSSSQTFDERLHTHAEALSPTSTSNLGGLRSTTHVGGLHDLDPHPRTVQFPHVVMPQGHGSVHAVPAARPPPPTGGPEMMTPPLPPSFGPSHPMTYTPPMSGASSTIVSHSRTPSDSALLARMLTLTPAERRVIAAWSGPFSHQPPATPTPQPGMPFPIVQSLQHDARVFTPGVGVPTQSGFGAAAVESALPRQRAAPPAHLQDIGYGFPHPELGTTPAASLFPPLSGQSRSRSDLEHVSETERLFVAHSVDEGGYDDDEAEDSEMQAWRVTPESRSAPQSSGAARDDERQARSLERPSSIVKPRCTKSDSF